MEIAKSPTRAAFVSGATQGIGLAIAESLAEAGIRLFLVARSESSLERTCNEFRRLYGTECAWTSADFTVEGAAAGAASKALDVLGEVDIVINNAGRSMPASLSTPASEWIIGYRLNFLSHLDVMRVLLPPMQARGWGRIISIIGSSYRQPGSLNIGTTAKFGLLATSKVLAREVAEQGITVNCVAVGKIESGQSTSNYPSDTDLRKAVESQIPAGRLGWPSEVAAAANFLVSDAASYVTGSTLTVDGGYATAIS